ncbi:uncharacterized protein LOC120335099 [Styela clava]
MRSLARFAFSVFVFVISCSISHADQQQVCQNLCSSFLTSSSSVTSQANDLSQGRPGKRGPTGPKGDNGEIGPYGIVDYDRVGVMLERKVGNAVATINTRVEEMAEKLETALIRINDTIEKLEEKISDHCSTLLYNGKCFEVILHKESGVQYTEGGNLCKSKGWKLANIYSMEHYNLILEYLRKESRNIYVWLGMTYNTRTKRVMLSNGARAPTFPWHTGYPNTLPEENLIGLASKMNPQSITQGLHNASPGWTRMGALCEY